MESTSSSNPLNKPLKMRKSKISLIFLSLILSSCGNEVKPSLDSSSNSSEISSSSDDISSEISSSQTSSSSSKEEVLPLELNAANMIESLGKISASNNFTIYQKNIFNKPTNEIYYTEKYIYYPYYSAGFLKLKSFDQEYTNSEELVYQFSIVNRELQLLSPLMSGDILTGQKPYTSLTSFNYMLDLDASSLEENDFKLKDGYLFTTNKSVIKALASMMGYAKEASEDYFYKAKMSFDKTNNIEFVLQAFNSKYQIVDIEGTHGFFTNVGTSSNEIVDEYLKKNYELDLLPLTIQEAAPLIFQNENDVISLDNESIVQIVNGDGGIVAKEEINRSMNQYEHTSIDVSTSRKLTSLVRNNEDGIPSYIGLNGNNELSEEKFSKYNTWEGTYPSCSDFISKEIKAFRKISENTYRYYGYNHSSFFKSLCNFNGTSGIKYIDIKLNNDQIDEVIFTYQTFSDEYEDGTTFYYDVTITSKVVQDRKIANPEPYKNKDDVKVLETAFKKFDGTHKFQVSAQDDRTSSNKFITTYDLDTLTKEKDYYTGAGEQSLVYGWTKTSDNHYQRFVLNNDNLKPNGEEKTGDVSSLIGFSLSPNLFTKTGENEYMFDSYVLKSVKDGMILGTNSEDFLPSTFKLTVDPEKEVVISASYSYSDGLFSSGSETLTFKYDDEVSLKDGLKEKLASIPEWVEPKSWKEENENIYKYLQKYFSTEADNVPYIYDEDIYDQWLVSDSILELEIYSRSPTGNSSFLDTYRKKLIEEGFETTTLTSLPGAIVYVKGNISIRVAGVLNGGIYLWKTGDIK